MKTAINFLMCLGFFDFIGALAVSLVANRSGHHVDAITFMSLAIVMLGIIAFLAAMKRRI